MSTKSILPNYPNRMTKTADKIEVFGVKLDAITKKDAIARVILHLSQKTPKLITTVNVEFIMRAQNDPEFKDILNNASLNLVDGHGVIWGAKILSSWKPKLIVLKEIYVTLQWFLSLLFYPIIIQFIKKPIPERIPGSEFIWDLAKIAAKEKKRLFLLGYKKGLDPNVVEKTSLKLQTEIYNLKISGTHSGTWSKDEENEIVNLIKKDASDILMVGFGAPNQEKWLSRNLRRSNAKIGIGLGGSFDFIANVQKRAPKFFQILGLESVYRVLRQPNRIFRQKNLVIFIFKVLLDRLK